jgi:hypothetical protein
VLESFQLCYEWKQFMKRVALRLAGLFNWLAVTGCIVTGAAFDCHAANWALAFNGTGRGVTVTNDLAFNSLPLTVTFWMQTTQSVAAISGLATKSTDPALLNGWQVFITNGQLRASYCVSPVRSVGGPNGMAGPAIADGLWHYVAFAVDTNGARLHVDGFLAATNSWTGVPGITLATNDVHFGSFTPPGSALPFRGAMDEITVWNIALSPAQIVTNMNRSFTGVEPGLIAYYRCNEGIGPTLFDSAPVAGTNNGILDAFVTYIPSTIGSNPPAGPTVQTVSVNSDATNALLIGSMNAGGNSTAAWFEWGTTTNYGNSTGAYIDSGNFDVQFYIGIGNLTGGSLYHFRAVASNSVGVALGNDLAFTTPTFGLVNTNLPPTYDGVLAWGDFDNDGRLDFFIDGRFPPYPGGIPNYQIYRNTGSGFINSNVNLPAAQFPNRHSAWGDFDNDGRLDVLITTVDTNGLGYGVVQIFRNTGNGFTNANFMFETNLITPYATWVDFDGDGRLDVFIYGSQQQSYIDDNGNPHTYTAYIAELWRNTGTGFQNLGLTFPAGTYGTQVRLAWGDYDGDGRPDLLIAYPTYDSGSQVYNGTTEVWRNTGTGFNNILAGVTGVFNGAVAWADYDGDGKLDILLTGERAVGASNAGVPIGVASQIWRNTGNGFSNINASLTPVYSSSVAWGDYDNDGKLDLALCGNTTPSNAVTQVWHNTGTSFTLSAVFPALFSGAVAWGDYDNDGRLDLLLAGGTVLDSSGYPTQAVTQVWRNFGPQTNSAPAAPTGLTVTPLGTSLRFAWNAASDAQTPSAGLTYNLRVGSTPGGGEFVNPNAAPTGLTRVPQPGNTQSRLQRIVSGLPLGQGLYWTVQAVDSAFAGSPFAPQQGFGFNTVLTPVSGVPVAGDVNGDGIVDATEFASVLANLNGNGMVSDYELSMVLSNYWPYSSWFRMTNVAGLGGTNVTFQISNSTATAFTVQYSTNLSNWFDLGQAMPRYSFIDTNAPAQPQRYYRLRYP